MTLYVTVNCFVCKIEKIGYSGQALCDDGRSETYSTCITRGQVRCEVL